MRRTVLTVCAVSLLACSIACRRTAPPPTEDRHLTAGYALLLRSPKQALVEFERSTDRGERKQYALGQAHEALGQLDQAKTHYQQALAARPGFIKAETALCRLDLLHGQVGPARERLIQVVAKAPAELPPLLLLALVVSSPEDRARATAALAAWPERARSEGAKSDRVKDQGAKDQETKSDRPQAKQAKQAQAGEPPAEYFLALASLERQGNGADGPVARVEQAFAAPIHSVAAALVLARLAAQNDRRWLSRALLMRLVREKLESSDATSLANLAMTLGELEVAKTASKAIQLMPEVATSRLVLGQVALASGDAGGAVAHLKRGLALLPPGARARDEGEFLLAQALIREKDGEQATPLLDGLAARDPENLAVQLLYAELDLDRNQAPAAVERLERLLLEHPKQVAVLDHLVSARLGAKDPAGAVQAAQKRVELAPTDATGLARLVELLMTLGQTDQALAELERRAESRPDDEGLWLLLASTAERAKKPLLLQSALERFTERHPESEKAWLSRARFEESQAHPEAVAQALERALAANPKSAPALTHLAEWSMRQQQWQAAADTYERLLALSSDDASALNNLAYLLTDRLAQPERAVTVAERAHKLASGRPIIEDTLGWALLRRGKTEDRPRALGLLRHANEFLHQEDVRLHFAVALHLSGDPERAREVLGRFQFRPDNPGHVFAQSVLTGAG
jgi:tetratricopeptide (TPR) repeat protein